MVASAQGPRPSLREVGGGWLNFYWDRFLTQFCYHLPLPAVLLLVVALLSGRVGLEFGVPHAVRYEDPLKQGVVGFSLAVITLECLFVGFLLQTARREVAGKATAPAPPPATSNWPFARYAAGILACFLGTLGALFAVFVVFHLAVNYAIPGSERLTLSQLPNLLHQVFWRDVAAGPYTVAGAAVAVLFAFGLGYPLLRLGRRVFPDREEEEADRGSNGAAVPAAAARPPFFHAFAAGLVLLVVLDYVLVYAWFASQSAWGGWWGLAAATAVAAVLFPLLWFALPRYRRALLGILKRHSHTPELEELPFHGTALLFGLVGVGLFVALAYFPATASPVTIACFPLFGLLAAYGFLVYVVDRALPVVVALLVALAVLAGLNPYKLRFPDLPYEGGLEERHATVPAELRRYPLDLEAWVAHDLANQRAFDAALRDGGDADAAWRELQDNRVLPGKDPRRGRPPDSGKGDPDRLLGVDDVAFVPAADRSAGRKRPLVIVAVSGGGIRSAAWTLRVLQELELAFAEPGSGVEPDFPAHVRIVAGASGGMLGAAYYVATLPPRADRKFDAASLAARRTQMKEQYDSLTRDCLTPIMRQMVTGDAPLFFSPWPAPYDRGRALEDAWRQNLAGGPGGASPLDLTFAKLREREEAGDCPSLVFSPMLVEDGRRLLISNLDLRYVVSNDGNLLAEWELPTEDASGNYSHEALELFRLFPEAKGKFRLGTAVRMSASFPFFSPAVSLPTWPRRRVVDAGYYDNYGVSLAASWLFSTKHRKWIEANTSKVVLVQVRDGLDDERRRLEKVGREGSSQLSRAFEELTSPLEGLDNGRVGSSSFRNDGQVELLSAFMRQRQFGDETPGDQLTRDFTTVVFEYPGEASLNWYLTEQEKGDIDRCAGLVAAAGDSGVEGAGVANSAEKGRQFRARITKLLAWWRAQPAPKAGR